MAHTHFFNLQITHCDMLTELYHFCYVLSQNWGYIIILRNYLTKQAFQRGLRYPRNQFMLLGEYNDEWLVEVIPNRDLGCSLEERRETLKYALTVSVGEVVRCNPYRMCAENVLVLQTAVGFRRKFFQQASIPENEPLGLPGYFGERFLLYSSFCYEATLTLGLALHKTYLGIYNIIPKCSFPFESCIRKIFSKI